MEFYMNFRTVKEADIRACLKIAAIDNYEIKELTDVSDKELIGYSALYFPQNFRKDHAHELERFWTAKIMLQQELIKKYKEMGYVFSNEATTHLRLNMTKDELDFLSK